MIRVAILTVSDTRTNETDESGKTIEKILAEEKNFRVEAYDVVPDKKKKITEKLISYADSLNIDIVLTTGGTGLSPRDVTPEATLEVVEKEVSGLSDYIRMKGAEKTKRALLSRGTAGVRGKTLILNLPGSPRGVEESLRFVVDIIPHALDMMQGKGH